MFLALKIVEHFNIKSQIAGFEAIEKLLISFHLAVTAITPIKFENFQVQIPLFTVH
jgi:hypothetical protein